MARVIKITFQLRRGLHDKWIEENPILSEGEPAFETDTFRLKIGDGKTTYQALPYVGGDGNEGKDGTGIESITYKGEDESGGNMYTVLLMDGTSYDITAPKGAKGDKGNTGEAGAPGKAATIQVGEVTTGAAGTPASVSNVIIGETYYQIEVFNNANEEHRDAMANIGVPLIID